MTTVTLPMEKISPDVDRVHALISRSAKGDDKALTELTTLIDQAPEIWRSIGDVAQLAQQAQIQQACGKDLLARRAYQRTLDQMRTELGQPGDGALENLLIEAILTTWLQLGYANAMASQNAGSLSIQWADYYQRRIDKAHRRFLSAIRTLATVRKLAQPAIQVNVAERQLNQVNVVQGG